MRHKTIYPLTLDGWANRDATRFMKRRISVVRSLGFSFVVTAFALSACAGDAPTTKNPPTSQSWKEIAPSELKIAPAKPEAPAPKQTNSAPSPANPGLAESRTPEEAASARAADPKDPSGAIIIKVPAGTGAKP